LIPVFWGRLEFGHMKLLDLENHSAILKIIQHH